MRFTPVKHALLVGMIMLLNGCGVVTCKVCATKNSQPVAKPAHSTYQESASSSRTREQQYHESEPLVISVTGFGALDTRGDNKSQQILMAMRASEVDAYRGLAERVKGVQISGTTKVVDFITEYDHLRALVDSYVKNAKVLSQGMNGDGFYETTLSLTLDATFFKTISVKSREIQIKNLTDAGGFSYERKVKSDYPAPTASTLSTTDTHYDIGFSPAAK